VGYVVHRHSFPTFARHYITGSTYVLGKPDCYEGPGVANPVHQEAPDQGISSTLDFV
jgi:hypothetical protein